MPGALEKAARRPLQSSYHICTLNDQSLPIFDNMTLRSLMSYTNFRRSGSRLRSFSTSIPPASVKGNSIVIPNRRLPCCLMINFTSYRIILFLHDRPE